MTAPEEQNRPFTLAIGGPSGAGKTSLVEQTALLLEDAACLHFDDYGAELEQPDDGFAWIAAGADLTAFALPRFRDDLLSLKAGCAIVTPTGRKVAPMRYLVVEEPFGDGRRDMKYLYDFIVAIDIPMEIALARRLLQNLERAETPEAREVNCQWMQGYLRSYLHDSLRECYIAINAGVQRNAHLIVEGTEPIPILAARIADAARRQRDKEAS